MATQFTAWYDDVMPSVPGCPLPLALNKIREAAIEFCRATRAWRYRALAPIDAVGAQQDYVIAPPAGTAVVRVEEVVYAGEPLDFLVPADFRAKSDTWFSDQGDPEAFTMFDEGTISLYEIPSAGAAGAIVIPDLALAPAEGSATVDDAIFNRYRQAIAKGALAKLLQMPGKPYTNLQLGELREQEFNAACGGASARVAGGRGRGRLRSKTIIR